MSSYYGNYSQYLGSQRCCNLKTQGPVGPAGPTGPAAVGPGIAFGGVTGDFGANGVWYDSSNNVLRYTPAKSFIIDHPLKNENYLVHACLEGPEAGVYYRGVGEILDNQSTTINLPYYVEALARDFTIQITPIYNGKINTLNTSEVINNTFTVYGDNCKFYWNVTGKRCDVEVEPFKSSVNVRGDGPYLYI